MPRQLSLGVHLKDDATFENFYLPEVDHRHQDEDRRHEVVALLRDQLMVGNEGFVYLWGSPGSGISHLLQASCHGVAESGGAAQYLPLSELLDYPPEALLENLEQLSLVCLDDIQCIVGRPDWEAALFNFYNRVRDVGNSLLVGADTSPRELPLALADLQSRLGWGPVFQLKPLDDASKMAVIQFRASRRGMGLSDDVAKFLINRSARDLGGLMTCLDTLENTSLEAGRKLSIPFLKQVFDW